MSHSPFPYYIDPHVPTAVFDANGWKFAATTPGQMFPEIDLETAADNAALIAAIPVMVSTLQDAKDEFEAIRLLLIHELNEPTRSAFWKSVNARDKIAAVLALIGKKP